ncbi:hypothetical protein GOEFS_120_00400 [Gordonia effusa NBRC 100432]|uniref:DUF3090 domain-containing protein n=1 Tax=Gordonia effusa NBRC 100432 TaxID=1077974 RepID=H0R679_9ACTN|nr:DUF3090 domain-containing protein [Gordonia effusa]GAB20580.1 hypothetical protein GOEFS_120_00400 [Gordonia effusa NBRC 100432]
MSRAIHVFRSPDRFIAGTVGEPGDRTFFLQAIHESRVISVALEKQQVAILTDRIDSLLDEIARRFNAEVPPRTRKVSDLSPLITPIDAEFHVGTMGLGWDAEAQSVVVELLAVTEGEFDESIVLDDADEGPDAVRVFLTTDAARAFAARSLRVLSAGRPPCPLCGDPLDPAGHLCVRTNGYKRDVQFTAGGEFIDPEVLNNLAQQADTGLFDADDLPDDIDPEDGSDDPDTPPRG